mgnify:CR=1 FL=1
MPLVSPPDPAANCVSVTSRLLPPATETVIVRTMSSEVVLGAGGVTVTVVPLTTAVKGAIASLSTVRAFDPRLTTVTSTSLVTVSSAPQVSDAGSTSVITGVEASTLKSATSAADCG